MPDETEQTEPQTLREIAQTLDHPRTPDPYRDDGTTEDGDRIIKPDADGITRFNEEPVYKNEEALYEQRQQAKHIRDEQQHAAAEQYLDHTTDEHRARVRNTANLSTDDEISRHGAYQQKYQLLAAAAQRQAVLEARGAQEVQRLNAAGMHQAAHVIANQLVAGRGALQQEAAEVQSLGQQWQKFYVDKQRASLQQEVLSTCPGLRDPATRTDFKRWLVREHKIPLSVVENEWSPMVVGEAYKAFEKHSAERYDKHARADVRKHRLHERGVGSDSSSDAARKSLRERGSIDDALNYIALKRRERAVGL